MIGVRPETWCCKMKQPRSGVLEVGRRRLLYMALGRERYSKVHVDNLTRPQQGGIWKGAMLAGDPGPHPQADAPRRTHPGALAHLHNSALLAGAEASITPHFLHAASGLAQAACGR